VSAEYVRELAALHGVEVDAEGAERRAREIEVNLARLDAIPAETLQSVPPAYLFPPRQPRRSGR
jgi:hypothetical protein